MSRPAALQSDMLPSRRAIWRQIGLDNLKSACDSLRVSIDWLRASCAEATEIAELALCRNHAISVGKRLTGQAKPNKKPIRAKMNSARNKPSGHPLGKTFSRKAKR